MRRNEPTTLTLVPFQTFHSGCVSFNVQVAIFFRTFDELVRTLLLPNCRRLRLAQTDLDKAQKYPLARLRQTKKRSTTSNHFLLLE